MIRECKICGAKYETCYLCERQKSWRVHTDTASHYQIFVILMEYQSGRDASEVYDVLRRVGVDFNSLNIYREDIRRLLEKIRAEKV